MLYDIMWQIINDVIHGRIPVDDALVKMEHDLNGANVRSLKKYREHQRQLLAGTV